MSIDLRHKDQAVLELMWDTIRSRLADVAGQENITFESESTFDVPATPFHPDLVARASDVVRTVAGSGHTMVSATLHDATRVARYGVPTVMVFVQSLNGLSHAKEEDTRVKDLELAVVALDALVDQTVDWLVDQSLAV